MRPPGTTLHTPGRLSIHQTPPAARPRRRFTDLPGPRHRHHPTAASVREPDLWSVSDYATNYVAGSPVQHTDGLMGKVRVRSPVE